MAQAIGAQHRKDYKQQTALRRKKKQIVVGRDDRKGRKVDYRYISCATAGSSWLQVPLLMIKSVSDQIKAECLINSYRNKCS